MGGDVGERVRPARRGSHRLCLHCHPEPSPLSHCQGLCRSWIQCRFGQANGPYFGTGCQPDRRRGKSRHCVCRDLQLYRLPYGKAGAPHGTAGDAGRDPKGDRRVLAELAADQTGGHGTQAGGLAHRSRARWVGRGYRRHWHTRREPHEFHYRS